MYRSILIFLTIISLLSSCDNEEPEVAIILPTNLETVITKSETIEGKVDVKATAYDENYFTIHFEDGENSETIEDVSGKATHTFASS